MIYNIMLV